MRTFLAPEPQFSARLAQLRDPVEAHRWLEALPQTVGELMERFDVEPVRWLPGGSLSYVLACRTADGRDAVLKVGVDVSLACQERAALEVWGGVAAPKLLAVHGHAMLMEWIDPGAAIDGEFSDVPAVARCLERLHAPDAPARFMSLEQAVELRFARAQEANRREAIAPAGLLDRLLVRGLELAAQSPQRSLVHGDFQDKNLLLDHAGELHAIDPMPARGEVEYDAACWALTHHKGDRVIAHAAAVARHLGVSADRVRAWAEVLAAPEVALSRSAGPGCLRFLCANGWA